MVLMETTLLETFTAREIALELEIVQSWTGSDIDAFLRDAGTDPRPFEQWLDNATAWASTVDA